MRQRNPCRLEARSGWGSAAEAVVNWPVFLILVCWCAFFSAFVAGHLRVRRMRRPDSPPEKHILTAGSYRLGWLLQLAGFLGVVLVLQGGREPGVYRILGGFALAGISLGLVWAAVRHLGKQWKIAAVVADGHELITSRPYAFLRHPIYASLLGMVLSTAVLLGRWPESLAGLAILIAGTEVRVRAEESILLEAFPVQYRQYRTRTKAYLPWLR